MIKIKFKLPPKKESPSAPPAIEYPGCKWEIPYVAGVPPTSRLGCADTCKYTGNCQ